MPDFSLRADYLAATGCYMSNEDTRYYLKGVFVTPHEVDEEGRGVLMVATDGHSMAILYDAWGFAARPAILSLNFKDKVLKAQRKEVGIRRLAFDNDKALHAGIPAGIIANQSETETLNPGFRARDYTTVTEIDGTYPDFWRIVPKVKKTGPGKPYGWNVAYMAKLASAARLLGETTPRATFHQDSPGDPAFITLAGCPQAGFIHMPLRIDNAGKPAWLYQPKAKKAEKPEPVAAE